MTPLPPNHGDIDVAMVDQRRIMISGALDAQKVTDAAAKLMFLDGTSEEPVSVIVQATGDDLDAALALVDTLGLMRTPLTVDVLGAATGAAGVVVATAPGTRRIGASASMSLRIAEPQPARRAVATELQAASQRWSDLTGRIADLLATRTGCDTAWLLSELRSGATHSAAAAVELGLVDQIR